MTLTQLDAMKCRLCGQPPTGPGGLCADCSRALMRAREGSAAVRNAATSPPRKTRAIDRIVLTSPVESEAVQAPRRVRFVRWTAAAVVAIALVLAASVGLSPPRSVEPKRLEPASRTVAQLIEPVTEDEATVEIIAAPVQRKAPSMGAESPTLPKESPRGQTTRPRRTASSPSGARSSIADGDASHANGSSALGLDAGPPVQQARANTGPTVLSGDDSQALASALEKCGEEKFLAGVICEQKARLRYCEGKWGKVPQCTAKPRVD